MKLHRLGRLFASRLPEPGHHAVSLVAGRVQLIIVVQFILVSPLLQDPAYVLVKQAETDRFVLNIVDFF
jgi:hypothetical protein